MDIHAKNDIINYMIRRNPESTIKDFLGQLEDIKNDQPQVSDTIISFSTVVYNEPVNRYKNDRKGIIDRARTSTPTINTITS